MTLPTVEEIRFSITSLQVLGDILQESPPERNPPAAGVVRVAAGHLERLLERYYADLHMVQILAENQLDYRGLESPDANP